MSEKEIAIPVGLSIVDILIYLIPGTLTVAAFYLSGYFENSFQEILKKDAIIVVLMVLGAGYVVGHIMHLPATWIGTTINKILGDPIVYLIVPEKKEINFNGFKAKLRQLRAKLKQDFANNYKLRLREMLLKYWKVHDNSGSLDISQHFALSEILCENKYPHSWEVHERFYLRSCLLRGMILPLFLLGIVLFFVNSMIITSLLAFFGCLVCAIRYHSLLTVSIMQIYNQFYDFCLLVTE